MREINSPFRFSPEDRNAFDDARLIRGPERIPFDYMAHALTEFMNEKGYAERANPETGPDSIYCGHLHAAFHYAIGVQQVDMLLWRHVGYELQVQTGDREKIYAALGEIRDNQGNWLLPAWNGKFAVYSEAPVALFIWARADDLTGVNRSFAMTPHFSLEQMRASVDSANFSGNRRSLDPKGEVVLGELDEWLRKGTARALGIDVIAPIVGLQSTWRNHYQADAQIKVPSSSGVQLVRLPIEFSNWGTLDFGEPRVAISVLSSSPSL